MALSNVDAVRTAYEALGRADPGPFIELMHADVEWIEPDGAPGVATMDVGSGVYRGRDDVLLIPHVGGRYADIVSFHDRALEKVVEIYSDWGRFEWLLEDALRQGYRVGVVANSDGHKGRPGASHPGASTFGEWPTPSITFVIAPGTAWNSSATASASRIWSSLPSMNISGTPVVARRWPW